MPYNTTAILPRKEPTGQATLPLSRVKKIIALDQDISACANNSAFVITLATEMFIQHLAEMGHNVVKSEKKPRRNIQYRDLSNAISRADNLEFLVDVVPRTMPYKDVKQKKLVKAPTSKANGDSVVAPGQTTLDKGRMTFANGAPTGATNGFGAHDGTDDEDAEDPNTQLQMDMRARKASYSGGQNNLLGMALNEDVDMS